MWKFMIEVEIVCYNNEGQEILRRTLHARRVLKEYDSLQ
jgi:hypothetical protein